MVIAAEGYPAAPRTGDPIEGLAEAEAADGTAYVLHAGTKADGDRVLSAGGRVLSVTATGVDLVEARERAYRSLGRISLAGGQHRGDIALKAAQ